MQLNTHTLQKNVNDNRVIYNTDTDNTQKQKHQ